MDEELWDLIDYGIDACFDHRTFSKGENYFERGRVLSSSLEPPSTVRGTVLGSNGNIYSPEIVIGDDEIELATCTCPVGANCKHAAAVLLHALDTLRVEETQNEEDASNGKPTEKRAVTRLLWSWMEDVDTLRSLIRGGEESEPVAAEPGAFVVTWSLAPPKSYREAFAQVSIRRSQIKKDGSPGKGGQRASVQEILAGSQRGIIILPAADRQLILRLSAFENKSLWGYTPDAFELTGQAGYELLKDLLATGRLAWDREADRYLAWGDPRPVRAGWEDGVNGEQRPVLAFAADHLSGRPFYLLPTWPVTYIDPTDRTLGHVESAIPAEVLLKWPQIPSVSLSEAADVASGLKARFGDQVPAPPVLKTIERTVAPSPRICLRVATRDEAWRAGYNLSSSVDMPILDLEIAYGGHMISKNDPAVLNFREGDHLAAVARDLEQEHSFREKLSALGLKDLNTAGQEHTTFRRPGESPHFVYTGREALARWHTFVKDHVPELRKLGWHVAFSKNFPLRILPPDAYFSELSEADNQWFRFEAGFELDGKRVSLLPAVAECLRNIGDAPLAEIEKIFCERGLTLTLGNGSAISVPAERVLPVIRALFELMNNVKDGSIGTGIDLTAFQALALEDELPGELPKRLRDLSDKLKSGLKPQPRTPPQGFGATLRPYQQEGLGWLQFLGDCGFGGILADDMGLGKTVQTIAHLASEKAAGRLKEPSLVVAPTSVLHHWEDETRRFAPHLRVLRWHGTDRKRFLPSLDQADLIITTYALLTRDADVFRKLKLGLVILDEAQNIKNPRAKVHEAARKLPAQRRLALTGTPMENNLDELWAVFSFLLPDLLGSRKLFGSAFRTPIEKHADDARREHLRRRIAPFMLRRTKNAVVKELPPKTESMQKIDLTPRQVELYEAVRATMDKKVREAMAARGLARSHIIVLEALLKLRQVCCDPRLLKLDSAKACTRTHSAKLLAFREQIEELVADGRRVLVFSQFTSMLTLLEHELKAAHIPWLTLTGASRNRGDLVARFQAGDAPVFLISLKAGGTGLNLTAADTVIHYDPWWNPAVENQATDRAHRIGQQNPVFVYKLITSGTVEEKIVALQQKKQDLVAGLLSENPDPASLGLTEEVVQDLLAPLTSVTSTHPSA